MLAMDERIVERRRGALLRTPAERKTLLSKDDSVTRGPSCVQLEDVPAKRRKGLLSTPEKMIQQSPQPGTQRLSDPIASKIQKRPALLPGAAVQCGVRSPEQIANVQLALNSPETKGNRAPILSNSPSSFSTNATATSALPPCSRRVLLPFSSIDKPAPPLSAPLGKPEKIINGPTLTKTTVKVEEAKKDSKRRRSDKVTVFDLLNSDGKNEVVDDGMAKINKATMTDKRSTMAKSTGMDVGVEADLDFLYQQRSLIDQRISELEAKAEETEVKEDMVVYINGYYCRACHKLIRGNYADKTAHCEEEYHIFNSDIGADDPEKVFKYFEEHYEGIAFDDDDQVEDDCANDDSNFVKSIPAQSAQPQTRNEIGPPEPDSFSDKVTKDNGERTINDSDDDEDERASVHERFDRTRISRKT